MPVILQSQRLHVNQFSESGALAASERPVAALLHDLAFFQHIGPVDVANR